MKLYYLLVNKLSIYMLWFIQESKKAKAQKDFKKKLKQVQYSLFGLVNPLQFATAFNKGIKPDEAGQWPL